MTVVTVVTVMTEVTVETKNIVTQLKNLNCDKV